MLKWITGTATVALAVVALFLLQARYHEAAAQSGRLHIAAVDYDIVPGQVDNFLAALKENGRNR